MNSVSVIIPALNEQATIEAAVASAHEAGADEVIVVDGGSSDDTVTIACRSATVLSCPDRGRAVQQNFGTQNATGSIFLFLHADCLLAPAAIREIRRRLEAVPEIVGGCFRQRIDAGGLGYRAVEIGNLWRVRCLKSAYGDQGIFVRAAVFRSLGGFPRLKFMEDVFFSRRLRSAGRLTVCNSRLIVSARRWQQQGIVRQTLRNWMLLTGASLGISPNWLARYYP